MQEQAVQGASGPNVFTVLVPSEDQRSMLLEKLQKDPDLMAGPKCCYTSCSRCVS